MKKTLVTVALSVFVTLTLVFGIAAVSGSDLNGVVSKLGSQVTSLNGIKSEIQALNASMSASPTAPVRETFAMHFSDGQTYTVPDGKRLIVEQVSYVRAGGIVSAEMLPPSFTGFVIWNTDGQEGIFYFGGAAYSWSADGATGSGTFYPEGIQVSGGGTIRIQGLSFGYNGQSLENYGLTGYLEDIPA